MPTVSLSTTPTTRGSNPVIKHAATIFEGVADILIRVVHRDLACGGRDILTEAETAMIRASLNWIITELTKANTRLADPTSGFLTPFSGASAVDQIP